MRINESRNMEIISQYETGRTMEEVGRAFGITRQRVKQVLKRYGGKNVTKESLAARDHLRLAEGVLSQRERDALETNYRSSLHLFWENAAVELYQGGLSLNEVSIIVRGKSDARWTYGILKKRGVPRRKAGQYDRKRKAPRGCYPWDMWMDGCWHEVVQGREFKVTLASFRATLYIVARQGYRKVATRTEGNILYFCFHPRIEK